MRSRAAGLGLGNIPVVGYGPAWDATAMASMIDGRLRSCCAQHGNGVHGHVEKARGQDLRARGLGTA